MLRRLGTLAVLLALAAAPARADILTCPSGQLGDDDTGTNQPSDHVFQATQHASVAFQGVRVSGTSNSVSLQQCCTSSCGAAGDWATHTAAATFSTTHVINVKDPVCQYRFFIVSSTGSGVQDFFFRCGAELR